MHPAKVPSLATPRKNWLEIRFWKGSFIEPIMKESIFCTYPLKEGKRKHFVSYVTQFNEHIFFFFLGVGLYQSELIP